MMHRSPLPALLAFLPGCLLQKSRLPPLYAVRVFGLLTSLRLLLAPPLQSQAAVQTTASRAQVVHHECDPQAADLPDFELTLRVKQAATAEVDS